MAGGDAGVATPWAHVLLWSPRGCAPYGLHRTCEALEMRLKVSGGNGAAHATCGGHGGSARVGGWGGKPGIGPVYRETPPPVGRTLRVCHPRVPPAIGNAGSRDTLSTTRCPTRRAYPIVVVGPPALESSAATAPRGCHCSLFGGASTAEAGQA